MRRAVHVGIVELQSDGGFDETVERVKSQIDLRQLTLFALVDHADEARKAGLLMPPTKLLIFGSPTAGTPLMLAAPSVAIDLPLKILVSEDENGGVWISYNSPAYLKQRHGLPEELLSNVAGVEVIASAAAS